MTEKELFEFYNEKIKVLFSEIEARNNSLPIELLFEIHAAFDHIKRYHIDGEPKESVIKKAYSHLKRGALDAYKLKLKYHNDDYKGLKKKYPDITLLDNGNFYPNMLKDKRKITNTAKNARLDESKRNTDSAFLKWDQTSGLIDEFEEKYLNSEKLQWCKKHTYFRFCRDFFIGLITGILSSFLISGLF